VTAWFERLGANLVARGKPIAERRTVGNGGTGSKTSAYTLITADDLDAAVLLAEGCPALARGGSVEVCELTLVHAGVRVSA
jgi:hypothetical protein